MLFSLLRTRKTPIEETLKEATRWWVPGSPPKVEADKQIRNDKKHG
ncbi:hypothetical protein [Solidesulfovibrio sp. C21]